MAAGAGLRRDFLRGTDGYHQMDVVGEALEVDREAMLRLADEAEVSVETAGSSIDDICRVASQFATIAENVSPRLITQDTLDIIRGRIDENIDLLR